MAANRSRLTQPGRATKMICAGCELLKLSIRRFHGQMSLRTLPVPGATWFGRSQGDTLRGGIMKRRLHRTPRLHCVSRWRRQQRPSIVVCAVFLAGILGSLFCSCVTSQPYPTDWPAIAAIPRNGSPDLTGTYNNSGFSADGQTRRLSSAFLKNDKQVEFVQIANPDEDRFELSFCNREGLIAKRTLSKKAGDYRRTANGIRIPISPKLQTDRGEGASALSLNSAALSLTKDTEGNLIVKATSSGVGFDFFVIPVAGSSSRYFRFPKKEAGDTSRP